MHEHYEEPSEAATGATTRLKHENTEFQISRQSGAPSNISSILTILLAAIAIGAVIVALIWLSLNVKPFGVIHNPPTAASKEALYDYWKTNPDWIPLVDHYKLRSKIGVYNLAFYDKSVVRYNTYTVNAHDKEWRPIDDSMKSALTFTYTVKDGVVTINDRTPDKDYTYVLNTYEPFVFGHTPDKIFIVVPEGALWWMRTTEANLSSFTGDMPPNPQLSQ